VGIFSDFFGGDKETHEDDSTTERFSTGESVTRDADGHTREFTRHETTLPLGLGEKVTVTRDGDHNVVNTQRGWGHHDKK